METDYGIGYAIVSLIFVGNAIGFIAAAFFTNWFLHKLGRAKTLMLSELILIAANIIIVTTPPFGVVIFA
jgi:fucose permease